MAVLKGTPKQDGYYMPAEFYPQEKVFMIWPKRPDNWRLNAQPAKEAYANVAKTISRFTNVVMLVEKEEIPLAEMMLDGKASVIPIPSDDAWCRDVGPCFLLNAEGKIRACDFKFNAWGGLYDGLYYPWDNDDAIAGKICEIEQIDRYRTDDFILEGGSIHVDGEGTVLTTEMCLLSEGRNPHLSKEEIENRLCEYLGCSKVLWLKDGIDPNETNGHVDDVACFTAPGEVACIYTENKEDPFYEVAMNNYNALIKMTDAKGRKLKVHKVCTPHDKVLLNGADTIKTEKGTIPRKDGDLCIASYLNFLITNNGVIVPQYGDVNDDLAISQIKEIFPDKEVVGVYTREIVYGGGNIHCITMQQPKHTQK